MITKEEQKHTELLHTTEREKALATTIAMTIMFILNVPNGARTDDAVREIIRMLQAGLKEASELPMSTRKADCHDELTAKAREWFLFLGKIAGNMALPFDGEAPTMDELADIINERFASFLVSPEEIAKLRVKADCHEELELYRKALPALRDTFRMIAALLGDQPAENEAQWRKVSASTQQRCKHAMNHVADVLEQVESLARATNHQEG